MYFKKLELFGFKSFADRTVLNFEPGVTAIVGPNGCGKSNVFDSIKWVLGEQSTKELRGAAMEDVIFNGTQKKAALGFAEASITFSNECKSLPMEADEITITRRLFRSGESEYLLNKTKARLKDIQELLMGTGIGTAAYSMVQQGKVDRVVNSKPEERRAIFDEASGITKYKAKKKEALNKLKDTDNNLVRVNDITTEVKRQIGSIERQAKKAQKYKDEYEKLKDYEVKMAVFEISDFSNRKDLLQSQVNEINSKEEEFNKQLELLQENLTAEINYLGEIEQKINDIHAHEIKLDGQVEVNTKQIQYNDERVETSKENAIKNGEQKIQLIERCRIQQEKIEEIKTTIAAVEESIKINETLIEEKRIELMALEKSIEEARSSIRGHEDKILQLTSEQVSVRNIVTDIVKEVQGALARKRRLEIEQNKVNAEKQTNDQKLQSTTFQMNIIFGVIADFKLERANIARSLEDVKTQLIRLDESIDNLGNRKLFLKSQKEFIEKLHVQYDDMPEVMIEGRLLANKAPEDHHTGIIGKVKEVNHLETQQLYEIICETKFIELDPQQITAKIEEIAQEIAQLKQRKESLESDCRAIRGQLTQKDEEINNKEKMYSILEAQKRDIAEVSEKLEKEIELTILELEEVSIKTEQLKKREEESSYKLDTVTQDIEWAQNDIKERQSWISTKIQEKEEASVSIAQLETEINSDKEKFKGDTDNCKIFSESLDNWLEEIKNIDDDVAQSKIKVEEYLQETVQLRASIEEIKIKKNSLVEDISVKQQEKTQQGQKINQLRTAINTKEDEIENLKNDLHNQQLNVQELGFSEKGIKDRLLQTYKIDLDEYLRNKELEKRLAQEEALKPVIVESEENQDQQEDGESSQEEGASELTQEAQEPIAEETVAQAQDDQQSVEIADEDAEQIDVDELREEITRLQKRCESYGNVNLAAMDEYEELKERFEFLTKQQSDLLEAKSQLMSTINKINRSTKQMFMDTFTKVGEEFRIYYRMLFGGGEAQLVLLDPENVLESGIDIVARPPGKKLQNITLLSGGEKTLTAIALIFGVFKVNPSPFCVLDEIDAALDESNVGRFSYLLKDFAKIAQFIVITHNKKTISRADVMYGITMPETGISRLVSVKLSEEEKKQEEAVPAAV